MKYVRIFFLHFQHVLQNRARSFVLFLLAFINPLMALAFWLGAIRQQQQIAGWNLSSISSYYFLLIIAGSFLIAHIEEDVAIIDIMEGGIVRYLTKPFSYYWIKFYEEIGWRILQGLYGLFVFLFFVFFFGNFVTLASSLSLIFLSIIIIVLGYMISFTFKMIIGLSAFWLTDFWGLQQTVEVIIIVFAGLVVPINIFPKFLQDIAYILPFSYMVYFPVIALQGKLTLVELFKIIQTQLIWLIFFSLIYRRVWASGMRKFTGVGQ